MSAVDDGLMRAWLAARSLSRSLPMPVADRGGWRVESGQPEETRRYLFANASPGLRELGEAIDAPLIALKLCAPGEDLVGYLPDRWRIVSEPATRVMVRNAVPPDAEPPAGYRLEVEPRGAVTAIRILLGDELAASEHAAELDGVFIYDRIRTQEGHQRRGLGRAVMAALGRMRKSPNSREILTATGMGRSLYQAIGWRDYSPYSTAMIPSC